MAVELSLRRMSHKPLLDLALLRVLDVAHVPNCRQICQTQSADNSHQADLQHQQVDAFGDGFSEVKASQKRTQRENHTVDTFEGPNDAAALSVHMWLAGRRDSSG